MKNLYIEILLLIGSIILGVKPVVMKIGLRYIPVSDYNVLRLLAAVVSSWLALAIARDYKKVKKQDIKNILFISICGFFVFQWFYALGISKTTAGNTSVTMGTVPLLVGAVNQITGIEKAKREVMLGMGVSFIGLLFVILGTGGIGLTPENLKGGLYILISAIGYSVYIVFSKPLTMKYSANQITAYSITITALISILFTDFNFGEYKLSWQLILSILYVGAGAMYLGNYIWMLGIKKIGSNRVANYNNITPLFAVITAWLFLNEEFTLVQMVGGGIILIGLLISKYGKQLRKVKSSNS